MATRYSINYRTLGMVLLERLADMEVPTILKSPLKEFRSQHQAFETASFKAENARAIRDEALAMLGKCDEALDRAINNLANKLTGAGIGNRKNPFTEFGAYSPSALAKLSYVVEIKEVRALVRKVSKAKPTTVVQKILNECLKRADAIEQALKKLNGPQMEYEKSLKERDNLLSDWDRSFRRLKRYAAVAWDGSEATYQAVFAPPPDVQRPVLRRISSKKEESPKAEIQAQNMS